MSPRYSPYPLSWTRGFELHAIEVQKTSAPNEHNSDQYRYSLRFWFKTPRGILACCIIDRIFNGTLHRPIELTAHSGKALGEKGLLRAKSGSSQLQQQYE